MNVYRLTTIVLVAGLIASCANLPRSRDLGNPDVTGKTLAQQVCSNCHGVTGNSVNPNFPNLAAQQVEYFTIQLDGFRNHGREDPAGFEYMWGLSHNLTDKQIHQLAEYFNAQKLERIPIEGTQERIAAGKKIFTGGIPEQGVPPCSSCHGNQGQGNGKFPRIEGQHLDYLIKQLTVFQRTNQRPEGAIMKTVAHKLNTENIKDVAAYLQAKTNM